MPAAAIESLSNSNREGQTNGSMNGRKMADRTQRKILKYLHQQLRWLPIKYRINFKMANVTFLTLHSSQPAYLHSDLHAHYSTRSLVLSNTNLLSVPFVRTSFGARSFSVAAPIIWNSLPPALRMCTSPNIFRCHLKTHYFQQAFQSTQRLPSCTSDSASADHCVRL